jgi:formamidopyrimidine-DNA glycosylase
MVVGLGRRGKYLILDLEPAGFTLLIHLGMSGRLLTVGADADPDKYAHTVLSLDNGSQLRFSDARKLRSARTGWRRNCRGGDGRSNP